MADADDTRRIVVGQSMLTGVDLELSDEALGLLLRKNAELATQLLEHNHGVTPDGVTYTMWAEAYKILDEEPDDGSQ